MLIRLKEDDSLFNESSSSPPTTVHIPPVVVEGWNMVGDCLPCREGEDGVLIYNNTINNSNNNEGDNLSLPTSIPSEVGTLEEVATTATHSDPPRTLQQWLRANQIAVLIFTVTMVGWTVVAARLMRERDSWRVSANQWEEQVQKLQQCPKPEEDGLNLLNNCWVQAKAQVQLGNCGQLAKESAQDMANSAMEKLDQWGKTVWKSAFHSTDEDWKGLGDAVSQLATSSRTAGETFVSEVTKLVDDTWEILKAAAQNTSVDDVDDMVDL